MLAKNSSSRKCILLISFDNAFKSYNASVLTFQIPLVCLLISSYKLGTVL